MDPYAGHLQEPVTLHRYLYAGNNPVMMVDPTGEFFSLGSLSVSLGVMGTLSSIALPSYAGIMGRTNEVCTNITVKRFHIQFFRFDKYGNWDPDYGHWWIELGNNESYGWWPDGYIIGRTNLERFRKTRTGVPGDLNGKFWGGSSTQDYYHGYNQGVDEIFHPVISSDTGCQSMTCKDAERVARRFAQQYSGSWNWPTGQNCHSFQHSLMDAACLEKPKNMSFPLSP